MLASDNTIAKVFEKNPIIHREELLSIARENSLYIIFIIARSGSTWLMEMAEKSGALGTPQEWFNEGWIHTSEIALGCKPPQSINTVDVDDYISRTVANYRSQDKVMGIQLSPFQTECVCGMLEDGEEALRLITPFYLRRRNIVAQAISLYRSAQSGLFHSYQESRALRTRFEGVVYDASMIAQWCEHLVAGERFFEAVFARLGMSPARFMYEDIVHDPSGVLTWMRKRITPNFGIPIVARSDTLTVLGKCTGAEWDQRFREERHEFLAALDSLRPKLVSDVV